MNEVLQGEIARLVDSGYELTTLSPDGRAELQRDGELIRLRLQRGYVTAQHGLRVAPPVDPPTPPPAGGVVQRSQPGRVAPFGELRDEERKPTPAPHPRRRLRIGTLITVVVLVGLVVGAFVFSRAAVEGPGSSAPPSAMHVVIDEAAGDPPSIAVG